MKKRTLVCFLIFTLCVFYTSIPNTVFGQEASLAEQVLAKYSETLQREDIQAVLPDVLVGLKDPEIQPLLTAATIGLVVSNPDILTTFIPDIDPDFVTLLKEDEELRTVLSDPTVQALLQDPAAIDELASLIDVAEPPVVEPPEEVEPPVVEPPEEVEPPVVEPPDVVEPPVVEPPDVVEPPVVEPPPAGEDVEAADPFDPIVPADMTLLGRSRLGGLSLNAISGQKFVEEILTTLALPVPAEFFVDALLDLVPEGFLPKKQIRQLLTSQNQSIFAEEAPHLDAENFGNAITPDFSDFAYLERSSKHLTRDSLHVYTRVPSANIGSVTYNLTNGTTIEGQQVLLDEFQADTVSYTFQLEETLAATNLPAWPSLNNQLFSNVVLRYSQTGHKGDYIAVDMHAVTGSNGVVWETEIGIPLGKSIYYYFEVMLAEPVSFTSLDREALAALDPLSLSIADIMGATVEIPIHGWSMPDPRNLQMADRGIVDALFTPSLQAELLGILTSPQGASLVAKALAGQTVELTDLLDALTPAQQRKLSNMLLYNAAQLVGSFQESLDPMLSSVFAVPRVNPETESIWVAHIDGLADGNYYLEALVRDSAGNAVDQIQETFTVDTHAPEASIQISPGNTNATGYVNSEGIYVATAPSAGASVLNITGVPQIADVSAGAGYLYYQEVQLDAHGMPTSTWMPLTIESTMLSSRIWQALLAQSGDSIVGVLRQGFPELVGGLDNEAVLNLAASFNPESILALLTPGTIQTSANSFFKTLGLQNFTFNETQSAAIGDALGLSVDLLDHLVPVTFDAPHTLMMPIQGDNLSLLIGDYGIRAVGFDTLLNIGAYTEPTRLRIVMPDSDMASVAGVSIGDRNGDGDADEPYESGTIFANTTDGVTLTVTIDKRTVHPATIMAEYMGADGAWHAIGESRDLAEGEEVASIEFHWTVTDFDALVGAGDSVMVRAVASNALGLTQMSDAFAVHLDNDVHPVDLEVLALVADPAEMTNPDSGAPQGTVTINAYTPQRTYPETASIQLVVDGEVVGTGDTGVLVSAEEIAALEGDTDFVTSLVQVAAEATSTDTLGGKQIFYPHYLKWAVAVDTMALEDTITAESAAARDASKDENPHHVTAVAITADGTEIPGRPGASTSLSVDNVDDVAPLGPTNIVAVADVAGALEADADGNYTVSGIVDESVPTPTATFTIEPTADPSTYASVQLVQVDADGNETMIDAAAGVLDITIDAGMLANGAYTFHALAIDEAGNVQTDESPQTILHVANFAVADVSQIKVTAVDGVDVPRTPAEPVQLRGSITVSFDVDNGTVSLEEVSGSIGGNAATSENDEDPENTFSLMVDVSALADGVYTIDGVVSKRNGSVAFPLVTINVDNTAPVVTIQTPAENSTVNSLPTFRATYHDGEGSGVNGTTGSLALARLHPPEEVSVDIDPHSLEKDETTLVYTRTDELPGGAYRVTVQVADILGNVGEASLEFAINGKPADTTPPVITEAAPSGLIHGESWVTLSAVVNDAESKVISVRFGINDNPLRSVAPAQIAEGRVQVAESFTPGTHTVKVIATSEGGSREHTWTFTLVVDNTAPTISSVTPAGTIRAGLPTISASANDESGVDEIVIVLRDSGGEEVEGNTADDGEADVEGITRSDFTPAAPLGEGTYTIEVRATDTIGNSATAKGGFTIDFDTAAPVITLATPQNEARLTERQPQISITYTDAESGVDVDSIRFVLDDQLINLAPSQKSASQVIYTPPAELAFGQHTVKLEVSDMAHKEGNVSEDNVDARQANMAVHEFTFFIESEDGPVLASRPINAPNPFEANTRISFTLTRQSTVSIVIYDTTLRPVRVLVDNEVWDAGEYTGNNAIGWDGTTSGGEDLARGIYFCQIMVADGFEPEYAILKLALTR